MSDVLTQLTTEFRIHNLPQAQCIELAEAVAPSIKQILKDKSQVTLQDASVILESLPPGLQDCGPHVLRALAHLGNLSVPADHNKADAEVADLKTQLKEAWAVYDKGEHHKVLELTDSLLSGDKQIPKDLRGEMHAVRSWSYYRMSKWEEALDEVTLADGNTRALECALYIHSYAERHINPEKVKELSGQIGKTITASNAFVIRARLEKSGDVPYEQVLEHVSQHAELGKKTPADVNYANLLHNAARVFLDRSRGRDDLLRAGNLIEKSIRCYESTGANFHHLAAAHYWQSQIFEKTGSIDRAVTASLKSAIAWKKQITVDSTNPVHISKYNNAIRLLVGYCETAGKPASEILASL